MPKALKARFRLRAKLTLTYLAVGLVLTLIDVLSTRWLQQRAEEVAADRAETVQLAEDLATRSGRMAEEGFGYALSGDASEKEACLRQLEQFGGLVQRLIERQTVREGETDVLVRVDAALKSATRGARKMFEEYEAERRVDRQSFDAYEAAMDGVYDDVQELTAGIRRRADSDNGAARQRLRGVMLGVAGIAALLAVSMGAVFGLHLTRPLLGLRVAAARLGRGELEFELQTHSRDEFGEVGDAFTNMAANIRHLLTTVADQKRRLEDVFASLGEMLLVCAPDGTIASVNQSVCTTLGYAEEELIGKGLDTLLDAVCFADLRQRATGRATSGAPGGEADLRMRRKDGRFVAVSVSASLLRTNTREYAGVICVAQDISGRLRLEAELRQAQKLQAIGRLSSGVAHEINTPVQFVSDSVHFARDATADLARVIGMYQAGVRAAERGTPSEEAFAGARDCEKESDLPYLLEKLPRALERSVQGLDRIAAIVRSMKIFAHPGQAQMGPVDLNEAVRSTLTVAQSEYKYVADLETDLGNLPLVTCHGGEINQAILNLVVNAAHAIADNSNAGAKGRITVRTRRDGDSVVVSVSDTGTGIPEEIRDRIFDPFFTTKEVGKGTGQGLSVARSAIVEKHRGQLTFETEHGKGTTFHIRLPIGGAPAPLAVPLTAPAAA